MNDTPLFSSPLSRSIATTLGVMVTAVLVTAGMTTYLPLNQSDRITLPIILFPITWVLMFLWASFEQRIWRVWFGLFGLSCGHLFLILKSVGVL